MRFFQSLIDRFSGSQVDWDDLEEALIRADLGVPMTLKIVDELQALDGQVTAATIADVAKREILAVLPSAPGVIQPLPATPKVILIVGVNGTGKTTSTAKLASYFKQRGHSVMLAAADTFRAAAIEQLEVWAGRLEIDMIKGEYKADPAALCFDAYQSAMRKNVEFLICDTAGRLHTKDNLMQELSKIGRSLGKLDPDSPHETLLVVDATTGSNGLAQAREFHQAVELSGLIVTKLDGSGKGGGVVAIQHELNIPTRFIGTGESIDDLQEFDAAQFVDQIL